MYNDVLYVCMRCVHILIHPSSIACLLWLILFSPTRSKLNIFERCYPLKSSSIFIFCSRAMFFCCCRFCSCLVFISFIFPHLSHTLIIDTDVEEYPLCAQCHNLNTLPHTFFIYTSIIDTVESSILSETTHTRTHEWKISPATWLFISVIPFWKCIKHCLINVTNWQTNEPIAMAIDFCLGYYLSLALDRSVCLYLVTHQKYCFFTSGSSIRILSYMNISH